MLTQTEQDLSSARPNTVDFDGISDLHYLGNYVRRLPVNMARMMENAYDWEHLPYVHASSFASIDLIASGPWGWRAKIGLPKASGGAFQLLDLLVAREQNYWVSTVYAGPGAGVQIHTQAREVSREEIEVDVRFYLPEAPADESVSAAALRYLTDQYATLYDEDTGLMSGRQEALDHKAQESSSADTGDKVFVGALPDLNPDAAHVVDTAAGRISVRHWQGQWIAHAATCPHLLGPLADGPVSDDGVITCPWHGYRFDIQSGANLDGKCRALMPAPDLIETEDGLYLRIESGLS
ncbi:MAG: Rieske (2Fe-2S) protein [Pseudomonadota bacterium]